MAKIGYRSYVGYGVEASFGTAVAPTKFVEYNSEAFQKEREERLIEAISGGRQFTKRVTLQENVGGSLEFPLVPSSALQLIEHISGGSVVRTAISTSAYQYAFTFGDVATLTSFTVQCGRDTSDTSTVYNYTGARINTLTFSNSVNELLNVSADFLAVNEAAANTITTASYRTFAPYTFKGGTIRIGDSSATTTAYPIESINITIDNALQEDREIGSAVRTVLEPGMQNITAEITMRYADNTLYNRFLAGTRSYLKAEFDSGETITGTAQTHKITFEAHNCYFNGTTPNVGGANDLIKHTLPIRCIKSDASTGAMVITVISDVTSLTA